MPSSSTRPLSLAFLGCGWATRLHARLLAHHGDRPRLGFASRAPAKAAAYAAQYGGTAFASYQHALANRDVDVAVVATPPVEHLPWALAALAAGKDVVVEKPAFVHAHDVATVRQAAGERCVLIAENYCYKPLRGTLERLLVDGAVGRPLFIHIDALRTQRLGGWRDDPGTPGAGAMLEGGIHWVHFLANLGLSVRTARGFEAGRNGRPDRSMLVVLEYAGGTVASLHYSWEVPALFRGLRRSRISGTEGSITFETNGLWVVVHGRRHGVHLPGIRDIAGYRAMWTDFLAALRDGSPTAMTLDLAERDLRLVETIYASRT